MLGKAVYENDYVGEATILFGDFKRAYALGDRKKMTVKVTQDTETAFTKDQTAIRVVARIAGNVWDDRALVALISIP
jgi:HK97 family phage major capsid protein